MFFGADQFKNNLGNNVIIKCHECGDTNLRFIDMTRGAPGSGYICGNGHETWGSLDNIEIFGQTDTLANNVNDCCCEGTACEFPGQIYVNFKGIEGVQARESCNTLINEELMARGVLPIGAPCGPNCTANKDGVNGPWYVTCGCEYVQGPCQESTDGVFLPAARSYSDTPINNGITTVTQTARYTVQTDIPALRSINVGSRVRSGTWYANHPGLNSLCDGCDIDSVVAGTIITTGFFQDGYPAAYRAETPALITEVIATGGNEWANLGQSIFFYIEQLCRIETDNLTGDCVCINVKTNVYIIKRIHPSVNPTADLPQFEFEEISDEGIGDPTFSFSCPLGCGQEPSFNPGWLGPGNDYAGPTAADFCDLSNLALGCINCNSSFGDITATNCSPDNYFTFWPYRIPTLESAQISPTEYQYFQRNLQGMNDVPLPGDCTCDGNDPSFCYNTVNYPKCLEVGTNKCYEENSKYRIGCQNPDDSFIITARSNTDDSILDYRYNVGDLSVYRGFGTLNTIYITFNPIWVSNNGDYDYWEYPPHPNSRCRNAQHPGMVSLKGDVVGSVSDADQLKVIPNSYTAIDGSPVYPIAYAGNGETYYAVGPASANLAVLLGDDRFKFEQPHCSRRVKNPDLTTAGVLLYMVYTGDLSRQNIVLDRYYPTGDTYDFLWHSNPMAKDGESNQAFIKNRGDIGLSDNSAFPYPFIANSGSLEEPELIAIIHSQSGVGGQVAFQTFPVSYDSDVFVDPYYYKNSEYITNDGLCSYKTRVTVHGYGVMYPLIDDPVWSQTTTTLPDQYNPDNPPRTKKAYEYPVIIPGKGYEIGDKIEFRCWKTLEDSEDRLDAKEGNPIVSGIDESVWREECVETIVATATITELNDERLAPSKVIQDERLGVIAVKVVPLNTNRYQETYKISSVEIVSEGTGGLSEGDVLQIYFSDDCLGGVQYETYPTIGISEVDENGKVLNYVFLEPGEFWKVIRTGGIRWYEFDEEDTEGNSLITIGNCPCGYDLCSDKDCAGCASKQAYPAFHDKKNSSPYNYQESILAKEIRSYFGDPWYKPYNQLTQEDAEGCATDSNIVDSRDQLINLLCPPDGVSSYDCNSGCDDRLRDCPDNCGCSNGDCYCYRENCGGGVPCFIQGWSNRTDSAVCWPLNNTWEFPEYTQNYGLCACSGEPVYPGTRPYVNGHIVYGHKRPQYKHIWKPSPMAFLGGIDSIIPEDLFAEPPRDKKFINRLKDEFLSIQGCNPLMLDRFGKSYKFIDPTGEREYGDTPCRKSNTGDSLPPNHNRTIDDYCRVYGFYQQRQPSCNVVYRGQYIMRAAQKAGYNGENTCSDGTYPSNHRWTDCEPIIGDIIIQLRQIEAQFDISVGAPYNQDLLIPEQLPEPELGPDGKYEVSADPFNGDRYFNHGFYEPNRYSSIEEKSLPENEGQFGEDTGVTTPVKVINPVFNMPSIDGLDFVADIQNDLVDYYNSGVWDLPDPRSNCRPGVNDIECTDECENPAYASGIGLPVSGIRNDLRSECPYPWETWGTNTDNNGIDYYCMFKNNSAEIIIDEIEECEECLKGQIIKQNYLYQNDTIYPQKFWYSYIEILPGGGGNGSMPQDRALIFRLFGDSNTNLINVFASALNDYKNFYMDYYDVGTLDLYTILLNDTHRSVFWNMIFSAFEPLLDQITKIEIFYSDNLTNYYGQGYAGDVVRVFSEYRCDAFGRTGKIKSLKIQSGGAGYAFEIEERVGLSGIVQNIENAEISVDVVPLDKKRRRETYQVSGVLIDHSGTGYSIGQIVPIEFNDSNYRRGKIFINESPSIKITNVDDNGKITEWKVENSGEFYKYVGTDEHRAFPVSMVLNNYYDHIDGSQNFGRHAKLRPVIGVDKSDLKTYGRIKRVEVDYGGVDYVMPGKSWQIQTETAEYDQYGNPLRGLDIQHLVDPCKHRILSPNGLTSDQIKEYTTWIQGGISTILNTPFNSSYYSPQSDPQYTTGNQFGTSIKHYLRTSSNGSPIKWSDKVEPWSNIISSGSCPIGPDGNLLDRTYRMALVEENQFPNNDDYTLHQGNCASSECNGLINLLDPDCTSQDIYPDDPRIRNCGQYCPVFTAYDAHRFNIAHTNVVGGDPFYDVDADPPPYIQGCTKRVELNARQNHLFCYAKLPSGPGGELLGKGFREYRHLNSSSDRCSSAEYSNYLELGLWYNENTRDNPASRAKTISYNMGSGPIEMTISYNKDDLVSYTGICPSGSWNGLDPEQSGLAKICGCEEN